MSIKPPATSFSEHFNAPDADIVFRSSDNVIFRVHSRNLEITTGGFPPAEFALDGQIIDLTEDASTLELMFLFTYPRLQPQLEGLAFDSLARLSEAVEKYQIYAALQLCNIFMTKALPEHAMEVLEYSIRHSYNSLSNRAAPFVTFSDIAASSQSVSPDLLHAWLRYHRVWNEKLRHAMTSTPAGHRCHTWLGYQRDISNALGEATRIKNDEESICSVITVPHFAPMCCKDEAGGWQKEFQKRIGDVPPFIEFL